MIKFITTDTKDNELYILICSEAGKSSNWDFVGQSKLNLEFDIYNKAILSTRFFVGK